MSSLSCRFIKPVCDSASSALWRITGRETPPGFVLIIFKPVTSSSDWSQFFTLIATTLKRFSIVVIRLSNEFCGGFCISCVFDEHTAPNCWRYGNKYCTWIWMHGEKGTFRLIEQDKTNNILTNHHYVCLKWVLQFTHMLSPLFQSILLCCLTAQSL